MNNLIFEQLNINSLRNKFDVFSDQVKGSLDIQMIFEIKRGDSFLDIQMIFEIKQGDSFSEERIVLYIRGDIPAKLLSHDFPLLRVFC